MTVWSNNGFLTWTPERVEIAKTRYLAGDSATEIAALLGGCTRNSVCGKLNRMGITRSPEEANAAKLKGGLKGALMVKEARAAAGKKPIRAPRAPRPLKVFTPMIVHNPAPVGGVPFMLTRRDQCRWPIEPFDAPAHAMMVCCGAIAEEGRPYCGRHCTEAGSGYKYGRIKPPYEKSVVRIST